MDTVTVREESNQLLENSELAHAQKSLQESEQQYRILFENAPVGVVISDESGNLIMFNDAMLRQGGHSRDDVREGHNVKEHYYDLSQRDQLITALRTHGFIKDVELRLKRKDGSAYDALVSVRYVTIKGQKCLQAIVQDVTERNQTRAALKKLNERLEKRVEERTAALMEANRLLQDKIHECNRIEEELRKKTRDLEELNAALKVLLKKRDEDQIEFEEKIVANVKELILPYLQKLKKADSGNRQHLFLDIIESNLNDIISPFARTLSSRFLNLTPTEIQVANLVKQGRSTKEIAELRSLSAKTIDFHRDRLRKKLGIRNKKVNLRTHLLSLG